MNDGRFPVTHREPAVGVVRVPYAVGSNCHAAKGSFGVPLHKDDPRTIGGHRLVDRLGAGGMGVVYRARSRSGREVAVKVVHAQYAQDPVFRARFRQEVEAARRVSGAFTAAVVDADPEAEPPWMATQYVPGKSLAARIRDRGALRVTDLRPLALGLVEALRDIHRAGVVHRDLKPANVLIAEDGPRVIDFGISRAAENHNTLTETGQMVGTPPFMSPEQFTDARTVGPASDVFSLGALLVYCVTGRGPFDADSPYLTGYRVVHNAPVLDGVTGPLRAVLERCLAKAPADRPGLDELEAEFERALPEPAPGEPETLTLRLPSGGRPGAPALGTTVRPATRRRAHRRALLVLSAVLAAALAAVLTGFLLLGPWNGDGEARTRATGSSASRWGTLPTGWKPWQTTVSAPAERGVKKAPGYEGDTSPTCVSDGGSVYCGGTALLPTRVDAGTGRTLWRADIAPAGVPADRYITTVLGVDGDKVVVELQITDDSGLGKAQSVLGLDRESGAVRWSHAVRTDSLGSAYADGMTLTEEGDGSAVTVRSARDGTVRRTIPVPVGYLCSVMAADGLPYVECADQEDGSHATKFYLVDPDGSVRTLASPAEQASFVGVLAGELVFLESDDQDVDNGPDLIYTRIVRVDPDSGRRTLTPLPEHYRGGLPTLAHGTFYLATSSGLVTAFSPKTGARLWNSHTNLESPGQASVDASGRTVYTAGASGRVVALDAAKGTVLWESSARAQVLGNSGLLPTVWFNRGALVLSTSDGTIFTLDPAHPERKSVGSG